MFKIKKTNKTLPGGGYVQIFFFTLCPLNPIVSWRAMNQTTWCSILLYHMPPSPNDHREFHILSVFSNLLPYPNSQCQQALTRNTHTSLLPGKQIGNLQIFTYLRSPLNPIPKSHAQVCSPPTSEAYYVPLPSSPMDLIDVTFQNFLLLLIALSQAPILAGNPWELSDSSS